MPIEIKSPHEIAQMREAGKIVAEILVALEQASSPGVRTLELNEIAEEILTKHNSYSPFKGKESYIKNVPRFPASICVSVNEEIVHGIPKPNRVLKVGDIVSVDVGAERGGLFADSAWTFPVGQISDKARHLLDTTRESLMAGIAQAKAGNKLWDVIGAIQSVIEKNDLTIIREYQGHGVGRQLWEEPSVPNFLDNDYKRRPQNILLRPGLTIAIEPMVVTGTWHTRVLGDKWTVVTKDGGLAAHFEHTIAITENGAEIMTALNSREGYV